MVPKIVQKMVYKIKDIQEATLHVFNFEDDDFLNTVPDSKDSLLPAEGIKELMSTISTLSRTVAQLSSTVSSSAPASPLVTIQRPPPRQQRPQQNQSTPGGVQSDAPQYAHIPLNPAPDCCIFCGDEEHYVRDCHIVEKYIQQNKLARNASGKLVLPDGRYPPRSILGILLRDCIDNYWK